MSLAGWSEGEEEGLGRMALSLLGGGVFGRGGAGGMMDGEMGGMVGGRAGKGTAAQGGRYKVGVSRVGVELTHSLTQSRCSFALLDAPFGLCLINTLVLFLLLLYAALIVCFASCVTTGRCLIHSLEISRLERI